MSKKFYTIPEILFDILANHIPFLAKLTFPHSRKWINRGKQVLMATQGDEKIANLLFFEVARSFEVRIKKVTNFQGDIINFQKLLLEKPRGFELWQETLEEKYRPNSDNESLKIRLQEQRAQLRQDHLWARLIGFGVSEYAFNTNRKVKSPPFYTVLFFGTMLFDYELNQLGALYERLGCSEKSTEDWNTPRTKKIVPDIDKRFSHLVRFKQPPGSSGKEILFYRWSPQELTARHLRLIEKYLSCFAPWVQTNPNEKDVTNQDPEPLIKWFQGKTEESKEKENKALMDWVRSFLIIHPTWLKRLVGSTSLRKELLHQKNQSDSIPLLSEEIPPIVEKLSSPISVLSPIKMDLPFINQVPPLNQALSMNQSSLPLPDSSSEPSPDLDADSPSDPIKFEQLRQILAQDADRRKQLGSASTFLILVDEVEYPEIGTQLQTQSQATLVIPTSSHRIEVKAIDAQGQVPLALLFLEYSEIVRPSWFAKDTLKHYSMRLEGGQSLRFRVRIEASNTEEPGYAVEIDYFPARSIPFAQIFREQWMIPAVITAGLLIVLGLSYLFFSKKQYVLPPNPIVKKPVPPTPPTSSPAPPQPEVLPPTPEPQQVQKPAPPKPKSKPKVQPPISGSESDVLMHTGFEGAQTLSETKEVFLQVTQNGTPVDASLQSIFEQALKDNGYTPVREVTLSDTILFATLKPVEGKDTVELEVRLENRVKKVLWPTRKAVVSTISAEAIQKMLPKKQY